MVDRLLSLFRPSPMAENMIEDENEMRKTYRYWRIRQMYSTFIGYAVFYFVRQNMSIAMPAMEHTLGIKKESLGLFLTLHKILYGVSKFANGILGDRSNPRFFMAVGLIMSALMNIFFGMSSSVAALGVFWMLNGWFQGMGFPPCARILSHWFSSKERGTKWAIWNSSHQVGAFSILILAGYLVRENIACTLNVPQFISSSGVLNVQVAGWQLCFFVPALLSLIVGVFLIDRLRDTPGSLGLPPVEQYMHEEQASAVSKDSDFDHDKFKKFLFRYVFSNKYIWFICFANFFVYILRYGFLDWAPSCLYEMKSVPLHHGGWMAAGFEFFGLLGSFAGGWITDRYMKGKRAPVCVIFMIIATVFVVLFWRAPAGSALYTMVLLFVLGFFIYGPQFLVGVMTCDIATKHAAATAIGLTGFFGYLSGIVSGWGLGWTVQHYGWDGGFYILLASGIAAAFFFALAWNARPLAKIESET